ncbi:class II aldolase/adducin family protein [Rhodovulum sp. DZ06]|uniref:class II aldolase/adducin family protein n=1 Tax=Rhodovulum sp. DZ06 TaxID=3425126 RepID=UPI003D3497F9
MSTADTPAAAPGGPAPARPADFPALVARSAALGRDPLLVQAAGGNTSVKDGGTMWIKASGTRLAEAEARDIFVPVDAAAITRALAADPEAADRTQDFLLAGGGLRPSIETSLHAALPQRVVLHVHCVNTIAFAIREDAEAALAERLAGLDWRFPPYIKPGARLAGAVLDARGPGAAVAVLGNHGLLAAGDSVEEAEARLREVSARLAPAAPAAPLAPDLPALAAAAGGGYAPAGAADPLHTLALDPRLLAAATAGSLYPDHVIFCGPGAEALRPGQTAAGAAARRAAAGAPPPPFLLVPGAGALLREGASEGALILARCLWDVLSRLAPGAAIRTLTPAQDAELLDWDAEKYRKALNAD